MIGKDDFEMSMSASKSTNLKLKSSKTLKKSTAAMQLVNFGIAHLTSLVGRAKEAEKEKSREK